MKLFSFKDYSLVVSEEALLLKPFRVIWERDKTEGKHRALLELGYIYFMEDPRSDYQVYVDRVVRSRKVCEGEGFRDGWYPDEAICVAMEFYGSFKSASALLAEDVRIAINNLREYIKGIDLTSVDRSGRPLYTLSSYTSALNQIPKLIIALDEAERAISRELASDSGVRGNAEKAIYEDV